MSGKTTVKNSGTTRIIMDQGSGDVVAEKGDSIYFYYAGYVFESGKSSLFCTNRLATAEESGFQLTDPDYSIKKIRLGSGDLIPGLENGLEGVLKGEHSELVFSAKYGYYDKPAYNVPSLSALLFEIWITEIIKNIINLFEDNPRLGILGAPMPYNGAYLGTPWGGWPVNYQNTKQLAEKLDLHVDINPNIFPVTAYGTMMWYRANALKKALNHNLDYDFFDVPYKPDGTIMHAMERLYGYIAQDAGYYYADVTNIDEARSDISNYQYLIYNLFLPNHGVTRNIFSTTGQQRIVKKGLNWQYWRYKLISHITFGKMRKHYKAKKREAKGLLKSLS